MSLSSLCRPRTAGSMSVIARISIRFRLFPDRARRRREPLHRSYAGTAPRRDTLHFQTRRQRRSPVQVAVDRRCEYAGQFIGSTTWSCRSPSVRSGLHWLAFGQRQMRGASRLVSVAPLPTMCEVELGDGRPTASTVKTAIYLLSGWALSAELFPLLTLSSPSAARRVEPWPRTRASVSIQRRTFDRAAK